MIVRDNKFEVNGNAALLPKRKPFETNEELQKLKKLKEEHLRKKKQIKMKVRARIMLSVVCVFFIGFTLIYRYSMVYDMEKNLISAQSQYDELNKENDNLSYELSKIDKIDYLQGKASDLKMVTPDKSQAVYVNLNNKYVKTSNKNENKKSLSFFEMLEDKLFN